MATVRTYLQLIALGLVLRWVFGIDSWLLVIAILVFMMAAAPDDREARARRTAAGSSAVR
jgi:ABC-type iron transport system FetAB permease component